MQKDLDNIRILAIDTSCDDTSVAISKGLNILSNVFWSKIRTHAKWGGVVPSEAKRQHEEFLEPAISEALKKSNNKIDNIDIIAVTQGPGLAIALESGIKKAKELSKKHNKPLIAVNHMVGHIYSNLTRDENGLPYSGLYDFDFPLMALTISGGHTDLYLMKQHLQFIHIGRTLDDAVGEAFDKVGRMLGMGFPAGAQIEKAASNGSSDTYNFPRPLSNTKDYNWSFSGLKTAVLYQIRKIIGDYKPNPSKKTYRLKDVSNKLDSKTINDIAASFQQAAIDSIVQKVEKAIQKHKTKILVVGGGVIANQTLRNQLKKMLADFGVQLYYPNPIWLCTDNAAMIATAAYYYLLNNIIVKDKDKLDRTPNLRIPSQ